MNIGLLRPLSAITFKCCRFVRVLYGRDFCTTDSAMDETDKGSNGAVLKEVGKEDNLKRSLEADGAAENGEVKKMRIKKKKVAVLLSYCGQGYFGMQKNDGYATIEEDLFQAFIKNGIMDDETYKFPQSIQYQRAARTDKGVSAIRQVVSLKMGLNEEDIIVKLCYNLPPCIRVFAIKKVTNGFNSKLACDSRTYSYITPTFAFAPVEQVITRNYRIPEKLLAEVRDVMALFKGTRNYHNFTSRRTPQDPSCKRYITEFTCQDPFIIKDVEFLKIIIKGQSFMLHQIRKMVGLTVAMMRGYASKDVLDSAFKLERVDIPIAPSLNLLLEQPHYDSYNRRYGSDGLHESLDWSGYEEGIGKFCEEQILPVIYKGEIEDNSMMNWLSTLSLHTYGPREHAPLPAKVAEDAINQNSSSNDQEHETTDQEPTESSVKATDPETDLTVIVKKELDVPQ